MAKVNKGVYRKLTHMKGVAHQGVRKQGGPNVHDHLHHPAAVKQETGITNTFLSLCILF